MAQSVFDATLDVNNQIKVNTFDWSHSDNLTTQIGRITPIFCELVPNKGSNSSGLVSQYNVVYNVSDTGVMSGTGVRRRLASASDFSVDGGINYTCSTTGITIVWADSMSRITIHYFQIYCPDGYTINNFTFDGSPVLFSMSTPVNIFDGRSTNRSYLIWAVVIN